MKIDTLITDIKDFLSSKRTVPQEVAEAFGYNLAAKISDRLSREASAPSLRISNLGQPCARKLWYSINKPALSEPLSAATRLKFLIGDVWEEVLLFLAAAAGHKVEHEQAEISLHGVKGHIDAVVDGELVDAKSASTPNYNKHSRHGLAEDDPFGYRIQLGSYLVGASDTGLVETSERAHFLVGDKTLGGITLDTHTKEELDANFEELVANRRKMLSWPLPPAREFSDVKDGESGNRRLGVACSYCPFKRECWRGLRAFKYSKGPRFLTVVSREPDVPEITLDQAIEE